MAKSATVSHRIHASRWRLAVPILALLASVASAQSPQGPKIWLQDAKPLSVTFGSGASGTPSGPANLAPNNLVQGNAATQLLAAGQAQPLAMFKGDFDQDGIEDLVVGYATATGGALAFYRGNLDAFAPQSDASFQAIGRSQFPPPFLAQAQVYTLSIRPDFIAAGDFTGNGRKDLVVATRGGTALYILPGDGKGKFGAPQLVQLNGKVSALAAENLGTSQAFTNVLVGLTSATNSSSLLILGKTPLGFGVLAAYPLGAPASNITFDNLGGSTPDAVFLSGAEVMLLHTSPMQLEALSLPVSAAAIAVGSFIYDRNPQLQIAVLGSDGSIQIAAHTEFDPRSYSTAELQAIRGAARRGFRNPLVPAKIVPRNGWKIVERLASAVPFSGGQVPALFRTRISDHASDDVMVLNASANQLTLVFHPDVAPGATTFLPAQISTRPYAGSPLAAISTRVNVDGRPGVIALHQGQVAPSVMMPIPDPTFFVNRIDDPLPTSPIANACTNVSFVDVSSSCSIREAILKANGDTIMLAAGMYTLARPKVAGDYSGNNGALYVNNSMTIVGAGQGSTIIQAGVNASNGVDMVMAVNEDINPLTNASASISNLTLKFGRNTGTNAAFDSDGGCMEFDTGTSGNATLSLTNVTLTDCSTTDGFGGGIALFNFTFPGPGQATLTNTIVQNNSVFGLSGRVGGAGGIWDSITGSEPARMVLNNCQILNNTATQINGTSVASGGGILIFGPANGGQRPAIHTTTISGNQASGAGGGIWTTSGIVMDTESVISGNSSGSGNIPNALDGGGIWMNINPDTADISKVTITGNTTTGNGGGIHVDDAGGTVNLSFSRLAGNTAGLLGKNLHNRHDVNVDPGTVVTATNNWWGTNTPATTIDPSTSTCPAAVHQVCFDPFIVLTNTASPGTIRINQSTTLTADMSKDNHGSGAALAGNLEVLNLLPITFNNAILGTIPNAQPEALNAGAQATATFNAGGVGGSGSADATVDQQTVTAPIIVLQPPSITKTFAPATAAVNAPSTVTFSIVNGNTVAINASFTDTLPANLVVAATPGVVNGCGGTVTATAGSSSISFLNASSPIGTCTISVNVSGTADGVFSNSVTIDSTDAGNGNTSSANLTVINAPTIAKVFGAATVPLNGTTSLTLTLTSTNANLTLTGVAFTDNLPAGLVVASPPSLVSTCGGTATAAPGAAVASLASASLAPGASCSVSLNVTGTTSGVKNNSTQVTSTNGGTGNTSNASITVVAPAVIIKAFGAASIPLNGSTSLTFTIQNTNTTTALTGVGFTDTLPVGLVISTPNGLAGTCGGGTITAPQATNVISLSGATLAPSSSCSFAVNVTGTTAGTKNNTTNNVASLEGGVGGTASASISVVAPASIAKLFTPGTISLNGTSSLTFTITNPAANTVALTGVAFTDTLPVGLTVANASIPTCGGTLTDTAPTGIALAGATIAVNTQCVFSVTVTGAASGIYTNTTGTVTSTNGGTGNTATANLTVASPPAITKAFGAASIPLNGSTSLTFTVTNPNTAVALTGIAFTDNLPAGLVVATPNNLTNTCGGTATAVAGAGSLTLASATLAGSASCTVSLNVTGTTAFTKTNSTQVTSTEGGTGNTSTANITVVAPPTITKSFNPTSIPLSGGNSILRFAIINPNPSSPLTGVAFSDTLPAGLVVAAPPTVVSTCGGVVTAAPGANLISLSAGLIASDGSCNLTVHVTGTAAGAQINTTGNLTSTEGGTGTTSNTATLTVVAAPSIAKVFAPATIALNGTTSLTFTITNPAANTVALTGVAFTDTLPVGLTVANASIPTCGGTLTDTAPTGIALAGASIAVNTQCVFSVTVTGAASGIYTNTTGTVTSTNGGTGNTATANLTVASPPAVTKAFGALSVPLNGVTLLTFTITNPASNAMSLTGVAFTDNLPAGLVVATPNNLTSTCGGVAAAVAGSSAVSLSAAMLAPSTSCTLSANVTGATAGVKNNSVQVTSTEGGTGNTSNASITVVASPVIIKAFGAASIPLNGSTSLSFTIQNNNATTALTGVGFSDTLPAGLVLSTPNGQTGTCGGGTITATPGTNILSLTGAPLAASASCTFSVNVTGTAAGTQNNTTGNVTSSEGGTGGTASASISVVAPPSIAKVFNPAGIALNATTSLTFTITNPAANTVALTGLAFTDTLPVGLTVANSSAVVCGGTLTTAAPTNISLVGATAAASGQCIFSVTVTGAVGGSYTNTTGIVSSTNGGNGNTATANLVVAAVPTIVKSFGAASIPLNGSTTLSFTITNPNSALALTGVAFTDVLPAGLVVSTPSGSAGSCGAGTITAAPASGNISLTGGTLAASGSCTFSVNVTGTTAGVMSNTTGAVSSTESGAGAVSNAATLTVLAPPSISKAFGAASIQLASGTSLTFIINNSNATAGLTGVAVIDTLPAGLMVSMPNGLSGSCGAGTITSAAGANSIALAGGTIAANGSCTFAVNVTAIGAGSLVNTSGAVTSTNGGTGNTATATLTVLAPDLTITKIHVGNFKQGQTGATYTIIATNSGGAPTSGTVTVTDALPASMTATAIAGAGWTCTLSSLTCTRSDVLAISGSYPPITLTVNVSGTAPGSATNSATISGGGELITANDTASDATTIDVVPQDFSITAAPTTITVKAGLKADYTLTLTPLNNVPFSTAITLSATGVPAGTTIVFQPPTVTPGSSPATAAFLLLTSANDPFITQNSDGRAAPLFAVGMPLAGILLFGLGFRRKDLLTGKSKLWMLLVFLGMGFALHGCATAGRFRNQGTPPGNYTITVTGTGGNVVHSTPVTLTVQP